MDGGRMKTAIILAGKHEVTNERYQDIVKAFKESGWDQVILYEPDWQQRTVKGLVDNFLSSFPVEDSSLTLLGFSLGAMIALIASDTLDIENLVLCSPSGYFREYVPLLPADDLIYARTELGDFEEYSSVEVVNKSKAKNGYIIAGENELTEWPDFKKWIGDFRAQTAWKYIEIPDVGHEIEAPAYQGAIMSWVAESEQRK
jgi:hypothetical protein